MTRRRALYASLVAETNTFSSIPTTAASFEHAGLLRGASLLDPATSGAASGVAALAAHLAGLGVDLVPSLFAHADSGAPVQHGVYERYRDMILEDLAAAQPLDAVLLFLHGAMVSSQCLDCEGDLLARVRALVGAAMPVGVLLDPHAHLSEQMVRHASVLICMREYPHVDGAARLRELTDLVLGLSSRAIEPVAAVVDCDLIGLFPTVDPPLRALVERLHGYEREPGILSVSFVHGFPWGDTPDTGARVLVYADARVGGEDRARERAARLAGRIRDDVLETTGHTQLQLVTPGEIARLLASGPAPIVFADLADNAGGGAPSDSTFILEALLEQGVRDVALGLIHDPQSVHFCHDVGVGGRLALRVGGKTGPESGRPVDLDAEVLGLARDARMSAFGFYDVDIGDTAWIRAAGLDLVLNTRRHQLFDPSGFSHIGLDPRQRRGLVVKSTAHFRAGFRDLARQVHLVSTPGAIDPDFTRIAYRHRRRVGAAANIGRDARLTTHPSR